MDTDKALEKQKAERIAAHATDGSANSNNSRRKDEPWLAAGIVVKVIDHIKQT